ncbi:Tyrosine kinase receptor Cad96Ca [Holothuria leucospilota]|uniref:Tyrosine kinase receptor Cad96Ca n=1 Tax=Holothuria leucospilota TaxID=206669 RepID=A0A9Q1HIY8_HOLLE|nr:Tyrosine kinase receptor Cad96Ca [Holothuria leucospilota]
MVTQSSTNMCLLKLSVVLFLFITGTCESKDSVSQPLGNISQVSIASYEFGSLLLSCDGISANASNWVLNSVVLYINEFPVDVQSEYSLSLQNNYSLLIDPVSLSHEGIYRCYRDGLIVQEYNVTVEVQPQVSISVDKQYGSEIHIEAGKDIEVTCHALRAKPVMHFTWIIDNGKLNASQVAATIRVNKNNNATFDTISTAKIKLRQEEGNISCVSSRQEAWHMHHVSLPYRTWVRPKMYLSINDNNTTLPTPVAGNQTFVARCRTVGSRPTIFHKWFINNRHINSSDIVYERENKSEGSDVTFYTTSTIWHRPWKDNGTVSCIISTENVSWVQLLEFYSVAGEPYQEIYTDNVSSNFSLGQDTYQNTTHLWTIVCLPVVATFTFFLLLLYLRRKKNIALKVFTTRKKQILHHKSDTNCHVNESKTISDYSENLRRAPKMELPQIPPNTESGEYDAYNLEIKEQATHGKLIQARDMCLILNMKKGRIYNRWMGTIGSCKPKRCVVFSTLNDEVLKGGDIHWDIFVKRILDLPEAESLVKVEGICIDVAYLYLVHEHLVCETLQSRIQTERNNRSGSGVSKALWESKIAIYILDILKGMEIIHSFGFVHPGISPGKILVTSNDHCKLYDFCLIQDAPFRLTHLKGQNKFDVYLSPETKKRNEYTQKSDVWSTGLVIWEIMSPGNVTVLSK